MVTSPHHLGATMNTDRRHRMTDLRPAGARRHVEAARRAHQRARVDAAHPDAAPAGSRSFTSGRSRNKSRHPHGPSSSLMAAAAVVFVIACSNVANLILARSVRREGELAVRAALGAGRGALRRTLLAESLVLWAGGGLGLLLAQPLVAGGPLCRALFHSRARSHGGRQRALAWCGLALIAAVLLAYIPRLPHPIGPAVWGWLAAACGSRRARTAVCGSLPRRRSRARCCCCWAPACWSPR